MRISQAAFDLLVREEVSSEARYRRDYRRPIWPGASSGPTVGIGYDLGHTSAATIRSDWKGRVSDEMLEAMVSCVGKTGSAGRAWTARVRSLIDIPWEQAIEVHSKFVLPRWEAKVAAALPNTETLSPDSLGALVSLTFNRGPSFSTPRKSTDSLDRYREMRAIKAHMQSGNLAAIPAEFRSMKRLWPDLDGLRKRRDTEAMLFQQGLNGRTAAPAKTASSAGKIGVVTASALNFRDSPNGNKVGSLKRGTRIEINAEEHGWLHVTTPAGHSGYVSAAYVELA
jgi:GH24 family phage-related lysozyme (muramidase)